MSSQRHSDMTGAYFMREGSAWSLVVRDSCWPRDVNQRWASVMTSADAKTQGAPTLPGPLPVALLYTRGWCLAGAFAYHPNMPAYWAPFSVFDQPLSLRKAACTPRFNTAEVFSCLCWGVRIPWDDLELCCSTIGSKRLRMKGKIGQADWKPFFVMGGENLIKRYTEFHRFVDIRPFSQIC